MNAAWSQISLNFSRGHANYEGIRDFEMFLGRPPRTVHVISPRKKNVISPLNIVVVQMLCFGARVDS